MTSSVQQAFGLAHRTHVLSARRKHVLAAIAAYAAPSLLAAIAVQTWFHHDSGLASGDLVPPVAPSDDYRSHWNHFDSGAGGPGYAIVRLPYFEGLRAFDKLGLGEVAFQRLWLTLLFAGSAAAVVFLARGLVRSPLAAALAGVLATFNAYHLITGFDPVPLSAMIAAGLLGGLVLRAAEDSDGPHPLVFAFGSLLLGFTFVNPPHLLTRTRLARRLRAARLGCSRPRRARARGALRRRRRAARTPLQPLVDRPRGPDPDGACLLGSVLGARRRPVVVDARLGSIPNILGLNSSWAWGYPEYYPFAARLERGPFVLLSTRSWPVRRSGWCWHRGRSGVSRSSSQGSPWPRSSSPRGLHPPLVGLNCGSTTTFRATGCCVTRPRRTFCSFSSSRFSPRLPSSASRSRRW